MMSKINELNITANTQLSEACLPNDFGCCDKMLR